MTPPLLDVLPPLPSVLITLDFETFWSTEYQLRKLTTEAYVRDPRFQVIGVGVKVGDRPAVWMEEHDFRAWAARIPWGRVAVLEHHAHFDDFVLAHHYKHRPAFVYDTLSMARAIHGQLRGNDLGALAEKYGVGTKGKELLKTQGKRREHFTEAEWLEFGGYGTNDVELTRSIFDRMRVGFPVPELHLIDMTVRMFSEPVFRADQDVLGKALSAEREKKRVVLTRVAKAEGVAVPEGATVEQALEAARATLSSSDKFAALLRTVGVEPPMKPGKVTRTNPDPGLTWAFAKTDPGMQALIEHQDGEVRALAEARLQVKSTIVETRVERFIGIGHRGAVPFYLKYCGAHTHRWSGGDKMNPQNFNRGGVLRDAVLAPPGHVLVVVDSGQIEARVVAWVAGEAAALDTFRRNDAKTERFRHARAERVQALAREPTKDEEKAIAKDLASVGIEEGDFYSDEGSRYFGKRVSKKDTPIERQVSKNMVLGLGFNMGWGKFSGELLKGMLGAPPVQFRAADAKKFNVDVAAFERKPFGRISDGVTCGDKVRDLISFGARLPYAELLPHCAVTAYFVSLYRAANSCIAASWNSMGEVLRIMEEPGGDPHAVRATFTPLKVIRHALVKPNGLVLHYPGLRRRGSEYVYQGGKGGRETVKVYGGLLTENVVQSLARDIVAEQALRIRAAGYHVATTTHDEVACVVPEAQGEECLRVMLATMKTAPAWCADLPLNADGGTARSYGDAK